VTEKSRERFTVIVSEYPVLFVELSSI